ncbi:hypothetical protein QYF36_026405 [Acer negundo]|nr:hypothetical protein QYF36_026405 [Acer negundo]
MLLDLGFEFVLVLVVIWVRVLGIALSDRRKPPLAQKRCEAREEVSRFILSGDDIFFGRNSWMHHVSLIVMFSRRYEIFGYKSVKMRWTCEYLMHPHLLSPSNLTRNLINTYKFAFLHIQHSSLVNGDSTYESKMKTLHANLIKNGSLLHNLQVGNRLLNLCVESLNFGYAQKLFDEMLYRDVRTWTIQLSGFARVGSFSSALDCFRRMQNECVWPNNFTLSSVLKCCSSLYELRIGKSVHGWIVTSGIGLDVALENSILDLYVKCEAFDYAKKLFELMEDRDNVSWNIMVGAYLHIGEVEKSLCLFERLPEKGVASWNTIIDGLMKNGFQGIALELLYRMIISGHVFNKVTFSIALNLASSLSNVELGRWIHACVLTFGVQDDRFIRNSLIDMYCKCGEMEKASVLFQKVSRDFVRTRNSKTSCEAEIVSWSSMISGYVRNGEYDDAFKTFRSMTTGLVTWTELMQDVGQVQIQISHGDLHARYPGKIDIGIILSYCLT